MISNHDGLERSTPTNTVTVQAVSRQLNVATISVAAQALVKIPNQDIPVDSYALTAHGGGQGWVVLIAGNSKSLTPTDEPVSIHILRVQNPLGRGPF